eukprot:8006901-Pyramimonas_sp.AAC.1
MHSSDNGMVMRLQCKPRHDMQSNATQCNATHRNSTRWVSLQSNANYEAMLSKAIQRNTTQCNAV